LGGGFEQLINTRRCTTEKRAESGSGTVVAVFSWT